MIFQHEIVRDSGEVVTVPGRHLENLGSMLCLFVCAIFLTLTLVGRGGNASVGAEEAGRWGSCLSVEKWILVHFLARRYGAAGMRA